MKRLKELNNYINQELWIKKKRNIWRTNAWKYVILPMSTAISKDEKLWVKVEVAYENCDWTYYIKIDDNWSKEEYWNLDFDELITILWHYYDMINK